MLEEKRSDIDRRSGEDRRRELYSREDNFRYFSKGGLREEELGREKGRG